ncbi:transposase [Oscillospiraceae bacterium KA00274]|nr:transposase [Amygdalobacter nucleatus]MDF0486319.1 transposase [Amygdalobacter nucleatus]
MTNDGELVEKHVYALDEKAIWEDAKYDGFYAACTNLDDDPCEILKINHERWQIEDAFRMLKTEFKARPVFLQNDDRILAHFLTCFLALLIFRILKAKIMPLVPTLTNKSLINTLKIFSFKSYDDATYVPCYDGINITDALHDFANFRTDTEYIPVSSMKNIFCISKKSK